MKESLREEGYASAPDPGFGLNFDELANGFRTLREKGWPPVFVFVYQPYWQLIQHATLFVDMLMGAPSRRLPDIWSWHLEPSLHETGWEPHRDKGKKALFEDGRPKSLTLWLPVTEATPENGCLYILPKNKDPHYGQEKEMRPNVPLTEIRALPSEPGRIFLWDQAVLHWSGRAHPKAKGPRISLSCEYQRADVAPFKEPLDDPFRLPPFQERLALIARQILQYRHMEPLSPQVEAWLLEAASVSPP